MIEANQIVKHIFSKKAFVIVTGDVIDGKIQIRDIISSLHVTERVNLLIPMKDSLGGLFYFDEGADRVITEPPARAIGFIVNDKPTKNIKNPPAVHSKPTRLSDVPIKKET